MLNPMRRVGTGLVAIALCGVGCGDDDPNPAPPGASGASGIVTAGLDTGGNDGDDDDDDKLDLAVGGDLGPAGDCGDDGMGGDVDFSFIWIANSPAGTVSKIDTKTGVEVGRFFTGPGNGIDDPSRTSVNLAGDVAVTNRGGSITKIAARNADCIDTNGNGVIDTSTGPADVKPYGEDECVLWNIPLPGGGGGNQQGPRPTAWDVGDSGNPCVVDDDRVWVGWFELPANQGHFYRLDGSTGGLLDDVTAPGWDVTGIKSYGPYGGAADAGGNFWVTGLQGPLVRIDGESLEVQQWEFPEASAAYGMTLDAEGHVWTAGLTGAITHVDPDSQSFEVFPIGADPLRGLMIDREGYAWAAKNGVCGLVQFDIETKSIVNAAIPLPGCATPVGVSIDIDGFVWVPDQGANLAFRVDPDTYATQTTMGLQAPYTYSDMTGAGLGLVVHPPAG